MKKLYFSVIPLLLVIGLLSTSLAHAQVPGATINLRKPANTASFKYQVQGYSYWCTIINGPSSSITVSSELLHTKNDGSGGAYAQDGDQVLYIQAYSDSSCSQEIPHTGVSSFTLQANLCVDLVNQKGSSSACPTN